MNKGLATGVRVTLYQASTALYIIVNTMNSLEIILRGDCLRPREQVELVRRKRTDATLLKLHHMSELSTQRSRFNVKQAQHHVRYAHALSNGYRDRVPTVR